MASDPQRPSRDPFVAGLVVGCSSPLILLFLLCVVVCGGAVVVDRDREEKDARRERDRDPPSLPEIDPSTPAAGLLPEPPEAGAAPVYLGDDLACVPEVMLEAAPELTNAEWRRRKAHASAAALHLNGRREDGYLKALLASRP